LWVNKPLEEDKRLGLVLPSVDADLVGQRSGRSCAFLGDRGTDHQLDVTASIEPLCLQGGILSQLPSLDERVQTPDLLVCAPIPLEDYSVEVSVITIGPFRNEYGLPPTRKLNGRSGEIPVHTCRTPNPFITVCLLMQDVNTAIPLHRPSSNDKRVTGNVSQITRSGSCKAFPGL